MGEYVQMTAGGPSPMADGGNIWDSVINNIPAGYQIGKDIISGGTPDYVPQGTVTLPTGNGNVTVTTENKPDIMDWVKDHWYIVAIAAVGVFFLVKK